MEIHVAPQENAPNFGILDAHPAQTNVVSMVPVKMVMRAMTDAVKNSGLISADLLT